MKLLRQKHYSIKSGSPSNERKSSLKLIGENAFAGSVVVGGLGLPVGGVTALVAGKKAGWLAIGGSVLFGLIMGAYGKYREISKVKPGDRKMSAILEDLKEDFPNDLDDRTDKDYSSALANKVVIDEKPEKHAITLSYNGAGTGIICLNTKSPKVLDSFDKVLDAYLRNHPKADYKSVENKTGYVVTIVNIDSYGISNILKEAVILSATDKNITVNCLSENVVG